jgi:hypothetical protein
MGLQLGRREAYMCEKAKGEEVGCLVLPVGPKDGRAGQIERVRVFQTFPLFFYFKAIFKFIFLKNNLNSF